VLRAIVDPKGGRLAFSYDSEGRLTAVGNAVGQMYQLVRDVAGRVAIEEDFDGRRTRYTRDAGGRVTETVKPDGARLVYRYDKTDRVTRIESFAPGARGRATSPRMSSASGMTGAASWSRRRTAPRWWNIAATRTALLSPRRSMAAGWRAGATPWAGASSGGLGKASSPP